MHFFTFTPDATGEYTFTLMGENAFSAYVENTAEDEFVKYWSVDAGVKGILCFQFGLTLREGDREYFYQALDRHFPGLKEKYIKRFGLSYECPSDHQQELMDLFITTCKQHGILYHPDDVFQYLHEFPDKSEGEQLSMF